MPGKVIVWLLLGGPAMMLCLMTSFFAAAMLVSPDLVMQTVFGVPIFLIAASACGKAILLRARVLARSWVLALVFAGVLVILAASIYYGVTTPGEAFIIGTVLFSAAIWAVWRLSPRLDEPS